MARSLNVVIGADIDKLRKGMQDAIAVIQSSGNKMSAEIAKSAGDIEKRLGVISTKNPTAGTVRQLTNLAMEARALGPEFAKMANDIIREAGRIKDSIGDARAEVGYFASDTRRLDAVLGGVQGVAGAFGAVEGAMALTGIQSEDLQKTMVKLQGAMALVNGITAVQNALQAESAVMVGINTAATQLQTFVMGQATVAARVYSAALIATGAGAVLVAIGIIVTLFQKVSKSIDEAKDRLKSFEKQQERGLTLGQRKIKQEERQTELAISRAQAEGKNEAFILKLKQDSLERQKQLYTQYGKEALDLLTKQKREELFLADRDAKKVKEINEKYAVLDADLRYSINDEYQGKVVGLQIQANENLKDARDKDLKNLEQNNKNKLKLEQDLADMRADIDKTGRTKGAGAEQFIPLDPITEAKTEIERTLDDIQASQDKFKSKGAIIKESDLVEPPFFEQANNVATVVDKLPAHIEAMADRNSEAFLKNAASQKQDLANTEAWAAKTATALAATNAAFATLQSEAAVSFGEFLGDLATGEQNAGQDFGKRMLGAVAAFMDALGKALIATAIASDVFQKLILANPAAAVVAGIALVAGATIVRNSLKEGPNATAFAEGGIVSGPTLGLVGEYPNASSNPEVIAPLDKLKGMLKNNDSSGFVASTTIQGRDLALVIERYNRDSRRG